MAPILSLLFVLGLSLLVTRVATVALIHTGMAREAARFEARSAFTGVGFTTTEAESIVYHPMRRKIVMWLMLVGNVGIVTAMASLMLSALDMSGMGHGSPCPYWRTELALLVGGVLLMGLAASSGWVDRHLCRLIGRALACFTRIGGRDGANLRYLNNEYGIAEFTVKPADWIAGRALGELRLASEGMLVLGLAIPGKSFVESPGPVTMIEVGDTLFVYGRADRVAALDLGPAGAPNDRHHTDPVGEQSRGGPGEQGETVR